MGNTFSQMLGDQIARRRIAAVAALAGVVVAAFLILRSGDESESIAADFARAWAAQEFSAMHEALSPSSQAEYSVGELTGAYEEAQEIATVTGIGIEGTGTAVDVDGGKAVPIEVVLRTAVFGEIAGTLVLPVSEQGVRWAPHLVFPGLGEGEQLERETEAPERGSILAADGSLIAGGPPEARVGEIDGATQIAGAVAAPTGELAETARKRGFPDGALLGTTGLELALDELLAGKPGGTLLASGPGGAEVLAEAEPSTAADAETTIDPAAQSAATLALGAAFGGVAVLDEEGAIKALAGVASSAPQPPGSTFKIITAAAALSPGRALRRGIPGRPVARSSAAARSQRPRRALRRLAGRELRPLLQLGLRTARRPRRRRAAGRDRGADGLQPRAGPARRRPDFAGRRRPSTIPTRSNPSSTSASARSARARCWRRRSAWLRRPNR